MGQPPLKSEAAFQIMIPKKTLKNPQERDFLIWSMHLKSCKKSKTVCLKILH